MKGELRKSGIQIIGDIPWGTHFCQFYKTKKDLIDILVPYFKAGLENNEFCMWITSKPLCEKDAIKSLSKALPDFDRYMKKGQIEIIPYEKWYLRYGLFNHKRVLKEWLRKHDKALSKGCDGLRLAGNTFWLGSKDWKDFKDYEEAVNAVIGKHRMIALCSYSINKCGASEVIDVVNNHRFVLIKREGKWELIESSERKRAKKALYEAVQQKEEAMSLLDSYFNAAPIGLGFWNKELRFVRLNQKLAEINGLPIKEQVGKTLKDIIPDLECIDDLVTSWKRILETGAPMLNVEVSGRTPANPGITRYWMNNWFPVKVKGETVGIGITVLDITDRKLAEESVNKTLQELKLRQMEVSALLDGTRSVLEYHDFEGAARSIFDSCKKLVGAQSGYISLLSKDELENEVVFLDSGGLSCSVDPSLPMPIRGLRAEAYRNLKAVYNNNFPESEWVQYMPDGHVILSNVLFAPMVIEGKAIGLLGLANKQGDFDEHDAQIASAFAELSAIALVQKRTEEAVRRSEEYFRHVTENASDIITILEADGTIRYASPSVEQVLGYKQEDLIAKSAFELVHPDDLPKVMDAFNRVIQKSGINLSVELRSKHKDGSWRILEVIEKNLLDNLAVAGIVVNFRDITGRKKMEEEIHKLNIELEQRVIERTKQLHESREQIQAILDNTTAVIYLKDMEGRFVLINRQFEKLFNITREEIVGKTDYELWPKEMADAFRKNDLEVLKARAPLEIEEIAPHSDGIHTYISIKFPLFDSYGILYGVCGISTDITGRKMAEKTIKEQSDILDSLFKDTITPLVLLDRDFNFIRVNEAYAKVCAKDIAEFYGHNHFEYYPHEENEAIFRQVVESKVPYQAAAKAFVFPDHPEWGVTYWDWTLTPLLDENGDVKYLVFSLNDVTESKKAENAVRAERQRLYDVLETLPVYVVLLTPNYQVPFANRFFRQRFGESHGRRCFEYLFGRSAPCKICETYTVLKTMKPHEWEWRGPDGRDYHVYDFPFRDTDGSVLILEMGFDITERKGEENRELFTTGLLELFAKTELRKEYIESVVQTIHEWSGCRCVGIRVADKKGNIPYYAYTGFSPEFWELENMLSLNKDICACVRAVTGQFEPQDYSILTPNGSLCINDSQKFAGSLTKDELARFRGTCIRSKFLSIALVPIRYRNRTIGLIHLADERAGMLPVSAVEFLEVMSNLIGEAIHRFETEEALRESESSLSEAQRIAHVGNWSWEVQTNELHWSDEIYRIFGLLTHQFNPTYDAFLEFVHPDDRESLQEAVQKAFFEKEPYIFDHRIVLPDGMERVVHEQGEVIFDDNGKPVRMVGTVQDITDLKRIENELRRSEAQLRQLSFQLMNAQEQERRRISRELHDELGQALSLIKLRVRYISKKLREDQEALNDECEDIRLYIDQVIENVRRLSRDLSPTILEDLGLTAALRWLIHAFMKNNENINVKHDIMDIDNLFSQGAQINIYRIIQESITNIEKHAQANNVSVIIQRLQDQVSFVVEDDGKGYDKNEGFGDEVFEKGLGLKSLKERVWMLRGVFDISSNEGKGTRITINIPLTKGEQ
jgi:PAS domain S-box-containing protein